LSPAFLVLKNLLECRGDHFQIVLKKRLSNFDFEDISNNIIYPRCFHLNRVNCKDSKIETHFESSKTSRGSYLYLEVYQFLSKYLNSIS
jgi:hypothetical protein